MTTTTNTAADPEMSAVPEPPRAITDYLGYLDDPTSVLDTEQIALTEAALADSELASGERLRLRMQLLRLHDADDSAMVDAFVKAAPGYIEACGVNPDDGKAVLSELGIPADVLDRLPTRRATRNGKVSVDDVYTWIRSRRTAFTKPDAVATTGASQGTVNKAVKLALTDKVITDMGGNPKRYQRS